MRPPTINCVDCGAEREVTPFGRLPQRCKDCAHKRVVFLTCKHAKEKRLARRECVFNAALRIAEAYNASDFQRVSDLIPNLVAAVGQSNLGGSDRAPTAVTETEEGER